MVKRIMRRIVASLFFGALLTPFLFAVPAHAITTSIFSNDIYSIRWDIDLPNNADSPSLSNIPLSVTFKDTLTNKKPSGGTMRAKANGGTFSTISLRDNPAVSFSSLLSPIGSLLDPILFFESNSGGLFDFTAFDAGRFDSKDYAFQINIRDLLLSGCPVCAFDGGAGVIKLTAAPALVRSGSPTTLSWELHNVTTCALSGTNGDSWNWDAIRAATSIRSRPITESTTFTLACTGTDGAAYTAQAIVTRSPVFQEL